MTTKMGTFGQPPREGTVHLFEVSVWAFANACDHFSCSYGPPQCNPNFLASGDPQVWKALVTHGMLERGLSAAEALAAQPRETRL